MGSEMCIRDSFNGSGCLSDGNHQVTLEVCDSQGQCTNETREIELVNLPPVLSVKTTPSISSWGVLFLGETASLTVSLNGTFDPEGADLWCWVEASYESGPDPDPNSPFCQMEIVRSIHRCPRGRIHSLSRCLRRSQSSGVLDIRSQLVQRDPRAFDGNFKDR